MTKPVDRPVPSITCSCGFMVSGFNEQLNALTHGNHACATDVADEWYECLFTWPGAWIVFSFGATMVLLLALIVVYDMWVPHA